MLARQSMPHEMTEILRTLRQHRGEAVLATLAGVEGSSYRLPGARLLVCDNGSAIGAVSAGCLEEEIRENCFKWSEGGACVKTFHVGDDGLERAGVANRLRWRLSVCDKRAEFANRSECSIARRVLEISPGELPETIGVGAWRAAVVRTHHFADDVAIAATRLNSP